MSAAADLQRRREALVLRHVEAENDRDLDAIMATFTHPRYEIVPSGMVFDGDASVRQMILTQWEELPRMHYSAEEVFHSDTGLIVETRTTCAGTTIDMLSINLFGFDGDGLILERCYFDRMLFAAELEKLTKLHD
ncbi:nuclear transport factor 2 family protein [Mycolicibacterium sp. BiH015]|uniref:nuclear transport factor 2 family protein n=1 Tax=Mycolicibacterium sp. BiH015 TaxID=3018808 RepID=UPI0022E5C6F1|nr:nuclear transport factor 2 family protein [Mycolicibacterium sp. BiH015]MDA2894958.1 nuclear transport factor 2 family protein [Mycolicibacterium sp. BiH015]